MYFELLNDVRVKTVSEVNNIKFKNWKFADKVCVYICTHIKKYICRPIYIYLYINVYVNSYI
jgi:hypothetical protein